MLAAVVLVAGGRAEPAHTSHLCSAQDKEFIRAAALSTTALTLLGQDYQAGTLSAKLAIAQTRNAELGIRNTDPRDRSLKLARTLMRGMMVEYARAVRAQWKGTGDAGSHMFRSYSLANYGHDVLVDAGPSLERLGCSVAALLQE